LQLCEQFELEAFLLCLGGLWNAVLSTVAIGGSALGLFLRSQRTWHCKPLDDNDAELFRKTLKVLLLLLFSYSRELLIYIYIHIL